MSGAKGSEKAPRAVRCAIYTRKSTSEGLDSDFNTLDAQREAAEHYIRSQAALGWAALPTRYDDGGFTGGNLERPALQRLLDDMERGEVDMVVVYKVDRLSRSLLDFSKLMERFEKKRIGFVSITQHFDTSNSMGRLVLNVLLSFAQFERELISERTRDKIAAARRRGKWTGGPPVLGYQVDRDRRALVVVPQEAEVVRLAFDLYLATRSVGVVAERLNALGHTQKRHVTTSGKMVGGKGWDKNAVQRLLHNPLYAGKVKQKDQLYAGEHEPLVDAQIFERTQKSFAARSSGRGARRNRRADYLLTGILRCAPCEAAMTSSMARGRGRKMYRYYRCCRELKEGVDCPTGLLAASEVEGAVVAHVKEVARSGSLRKDILKQLEKEDGSHAELRQQHERFKARLVELGAEGRRLLAAFSNSETGGKLLAERLGELEADMDRVRVDLGGVEARLRSVESARHDVERVADLLEKFDALWDVLVPAERRELLHAVVRRVSVDPSTKQLRIQLHDLEERTPAGVTEEAA